MTQSAARDHRADVEQVYQGIDETLHVPPPISRGASITGARLSLRFRAASFCLRWLRLRGSGAGCGGWAAAAGVKARSPLIFFCSSYASFSVRRPYVSTKPLG
jgi:hypothetical protein